MGCTLHQHGHSHGGGGHNHGHSHAPAKKEVIRPPVAKPNGFIPGAEDIENGGSQDSEASGENVSENSCSSDSTKVSVAIKPPNINVRAAYIHVLGIYDYIAYLFSLY